MCRAVSSLTVILLGSGPGVFEGRCVSFLDFFLVVSAGQFVPPALFEGVACGYVAPGTFFCPVKQDCGKIRNHINKFFWKMSDIVFECHVEESSKTMPEANFVQVVCFCSCLLCTNKKDT